MTKAREALDKTRALPPQSVVEIARGVTVRRTIGGIPVVRVHYVADPERDPEITPEWKANERKTYSSQAAWDREQEIVDEAGGGELVFADTLRTFYNKIVITDPLWKPNPHWKILGGFDHGKTNPTALERVYVDFDGNIYFCGEYYMPGKQVWQKVPEILQMPDIDRIEYVMSDPSIFDQETQEQKKDEKAKSVASLYIEEGLKILRPYGGQRSDLTFSERLLLHWANLDKREPTVFIVCRNPSEKPQPGLHPWDCPNLLWELGRIRRMKLTSQQLLTRNLAEGIVDKDNHAVDASKYIIMTLPGPTEVPIELELKKRMDAASSPTNAMITRLKFAGEVQQRNAPIFVGKGAKAKQQQWVRNKKRNPY